MTNEPFGEEIPELATQLEGTLNAPSVEAMHAGLGRRQTARKRMLSAAGAFAAVLAIAGGAIALTVDRASTTATATADEAGASDNADAAAGSFAITAVAEDSAPQVIIDSLLEDLSIAYKMAQTTWTIGDTTGPAPGFVPGTGFIWFDLSPRGPSFDIESETPTGNVVNYSTGCEGASYAITWDDTGFLIIDEKVAIPTLANVRCAQVGRVSPFKVGDQITLTEAANQSNMTMAAPCPANANCVRETLWSVELSDSQASRPETTFAEAVVTIAECANGSSLTAEGKRWFPEKLPAEWQGQEQVKVTVEINGNSLIARDIEGNSAHFWDYDGKVRAEPCNYFGLSEPTTTVPLETTTTTAAATTIPLVEPPPGERAVLAIEADFDGDPGAEQIWLEHDGSIHVGDLVGMADLWEISDYWFAEQADLSTVVFDENINAVVFALPMRGDEDPQNVYQVFVAENGELRRIFNQAVGDHYQTQLEFNGDGTVSYVEDGATACRRYDFEVLIVARQRVTLSVGAQGMLDTELTRQDTTEEQNCDQLAG